MFFGDAKFSDLADRMTINQVIGMSHEEQKPMESGPYQDINYHDIYHDVTHFNITNMVDLQNYHQKNMCTRLLPSIYTFSGLIFQKLTCIRNNS